MRDGILTIFSMALQLILWTNRFNSCFVLIYSGLAANFVDRQIRLKSAIFKFANYVFMNVPEGSLFKLITLFINSLNKRNSSRIPGWSKKLPLDDCLANVCN